MATNPLSPPQKKSGFPDGEVMTAMQNKGQVTQTPEVEQAKQQLKTILAKDNIDPSLVVQLGVMAEKSLRDKTLYEMVKQQAIQSKMAKAEEIQPGFDYRFIGSIMSAGKLAEMLVGDQ
jgi:hypothetical protein